MTNDSEEKQPPRPPQAEKPAESPITPSGPNAGPSGAAPSGAGGTPPGEPPKPAAPSAPAAPAKPAATTPPKPAAPAKPAGPPPPPKEPSIKPVPLDNELVKRYKSRFGAGILGTWLDRKQAILVVVAERLLEIARYSRDEERFDLLADLTAVDWPKREKRFDLVLNLYSFPKNERLRIKVQLGENQPVASVESVWPVTNWLEREVYDMFGIIFEGHPNLKRLLLPEEWQGYPLRKDYDILQQDEAWVRENLGIESGQ